MVSLRRGKRNLYKAFLLKKVGNGYEKVKVFKLDLDKDSFQYKDKAFLLDFSSSVYTDRGKVNIFFDIDTAKQLSFRTSQFGLSPKETDALINRHVISDLVDRLRKGLGGDKANWIMCIVFALMGGAIGFVVSQNAFPKIVNRDFIQNATGIYPIIPSFILEKIKVFLCLIRILR